MKAKQVDFLLLNASNYPAHPIYPYAFVQVSAVARDAGYSVKRYDFLGTPKSEWTQILEELILRYQPKMIGFHLRQLDNQVVDDYMDEALKEDEKYFPVFDTQWLIINARRYSDVPIVIGGFAVSVHAEKLCQFLQPDYAVYGAPDAFFQHFDSLAQRKLEPDSSIANLSIRVNDNYTNVIKKNYPLNETGEYDDEIFSDLCAFYAKTGRQLGIGKPGEVDVPVEIMRGCPCRCYFCTEPHVKGKQANIRPLSAVMQDIEYLASQDVRSVWFICSEINIYGMDLPMKIADEMKKFNAERGSRRILWKAYAMPKPGMSYDQISYMMSSGYVPGWNEFASLDDKNLKACGMPYRSHDAIRYLQDIKRLSEDPNIYFGPPLRKLEMFLGNAYMSADALSNTLLAVDEAGLAIDHDYGGAMPASRIYDMNVKQHPEILEDSITVKPEGLAESTNTLHPTFYYSPELIEILGDGPSITQFFSFIGSTFLSQNYQLTLNVLGFLPSITSIEALSNHLNTFNTMGQLVTLLMTADDSSNSADQAQARQLVDTIWQNSEGVTLKSLYDPRVASYMVRARAMDIVLDILFKLNSESFQAILTHLELCNETDRSSPFKIMRILYPKYRDNQALIDEVTAEFSLPPNSLESIQLQHFLYTNNIQIIPRYKELLFKELT